MSLVLRRDLVEAMVAHARREHPVEACGVLAGPVGGQPDKFIPMENIAQSATFYQFDAVEQVRVWSSLEAAGMAPVVIWHSHTASAAVPSRVDVRFAMEPDAHYVIVSTRDPDTPEVRSYRITDGVATEEPVEVI